LAAPDILSAQMPTENNPNSTRPLTRPLRVLISAGEASGDMYGAELILALRKLCSGAGEVQALPTSAKRGQIWGTHALECFGLGGERMREAGCELVVEARDVAVVGLFEVLGHLPGIYRKFHKLLAEVDLKRPDVAVLIDFPDWNFRLARQLHRRGIPVVYYVSPQLWAWRKGRLKLVQRYVSEMLVIFPFEREFYARHGVQVEFVGHPLSELELPTVGREEFARRWGLDASRSWIALLPGSRRKELRMNLPAMLGAAGRLGAEFEFVMPVASTLDREWVREQIARYSASLPHICQKRVDAGQEEQEQRQEQEHEQGQLPHPSQQQARMGHPAGSGNAALPAADAGSGNAALPAADAQVKLTDDARACLLHARAGVVASGTATVEAALIGTPFVMVYRLGALTWALGRHLVKLPHYGMVNLVAGREVVPELIQDDFTPERVEREVRALLEDGAARQAMTEDLAKVRGMLRGELRGELAQAPTALDAAHGATRSEQSGTAAQRAARAVLRVAEKAMRESP
jgi:lipid-A-disaccharide synthase